MDWIKVTPETMPKKKGEYFIFEKWIEETEDGPVVCKLLGIAWFNGERFCDIISRWGHGNDVENIAYWMPATEPADD